jgi:hypothetical protein
VLIDLETGTRYNTCNFCFPPPRADFIAGTGVTQTGRLVFQAGLESYAPQPPVVAFQTSLEPRAGDGAVMYPEFHFVPSHGGASRASALLLNPFITIDAPDIAGSYEGPFLSLADPVTGAPADPTFRGIGRMPILPRNARGTYAGQVQLYFDPNSDPFISWPFLATASDDGRVIWVAQGKAGRIIYDGVVVPAPDMTVERLDGIFRLFLNEGRTLYNSYNCPISGVIQ